MSITALGKIAAVVLLGAGLSACVDVTVDVALTSETTAKATTTMVMGAEFHAMMTAGGDAFCGKGVASQTKDGGSSCVLVSEGPFAGLVLGTSDPLPVTFTPDGPGLIRVAVTSAVIEEEAGDQHAMDAETEQMMQAFVAGRKITIRFGGAEVTDTNMTLSADKTSAQTVIPMLDLMQDKAKLPEEFYAVVRVP